MTLHFDPHIGNLDVLPTEQRIMTLRTCHVCSVLRSCVVCLFTDKIVFLSREENSKPSGADIESSTSPENRHGDRVLFFSNTNHRLKSSLMKHLMLKFTS